MQKWTNYPQYAEAGTISVDQDGEVITSNQAESPALETAKDTGLIVKSLVAVVRIHPR